MSLATSNNNGNNGAAVALRSQNERRQRPPTLMRLVTDLDDRAGALYDAVAEAEDVIERLETVSTELRRRVGRKRARDARYRAKRRLSQALVSDDEFTWAD